MPIYFAGHSIFYLGLTCFIMSAWEIIDPIDDRLDRKMGMPDSEKKEILEGNARRFLDLSIAGGSQ